MTFKQKTLSQPLNVAHEWPGDKLTEGVQPGINATNFTHVSYLKWVLCSYYLNFSVTFNEVLKRIIGGRYYVLLNLFSAKYVFVTWTDDFSLNQNNSVRLKG